MNDYLFAGIVILTVVVFVVGGNCLTCAAEEARFTKAFGIRPEPTNDQ